MSTFSTELSSRRAKSLNHAAPKQDDDDCESTVWWYGTPVPCHILFASPDTQTQTHTNTHTHKRQRRYDFTVWWYIFNLGYVLARAHA